MIEFQHDRVKPCLSTYINTKVAQYHMCGLDRVATVRENSHDAGMASAGLELSGALG